jgi:NAD-dependent SIR2 family protein deacetylase
MPVIAKQAGARIIEFNEEETPLTGWVSDYRIPGKAGEVLDQVVKRVEALIG